MPASLGISPLVDGVKTLTLSNPGKRNALDTGVLDALQAALADDAGVRCWLLRSADATVFSSGYDLSALNGFPEGTPLPDERLGEVFDALMAHRAPSVALVTGPAYGAGFELALSCDFRVGGPHARFNMPPAKLGIVYAAHGLQRLVARVGLQHARRIFLTARTVDSSEAKNIGLLDVLSDDAESEALKLSGELAANAPLAVQGMKRGLALLATNAEYEALRRASFNSDDAREGKAALLEKRKPKFSGR